MVGALGRGSMPNESIWMFVADVAHVGALVPVCVDTSWKRDGAGVTQAPRAEIFDLLHSRNAHRSVVRVNSLASLFRLALMSPPTPLADTRET